MTRDVVRHFVCRSLTDRAGERDAIAELAAHQVTNGFASDFSEQIPTRHVYRRLDVGMASHGGVHLSVDGIEFGRDRADQTGRDLLDTGPGSSCPAWAGM